MLLKEKTEGRIKCVSYQEYWATGRRRERGRRNEKETNKRNWREKKKTKIDWKKKKKWKVQPIK